MDVNVVKKFCELVANGVISDDGSVYSFDENTINVLNVWLIVNNALQLILAINA